MKITLFCKAFLFSVYGISSAISHDEYLWLVLCWELKRHVHKHVFLIFPSPPPDSSLHPDVLQVEKRINFQCDHCI